jgi:hypothetical protein
MIVDVVRSATSINICRVRQLPFPGRVVVERGQSVMPSDIIAISDVPGQVLVLDLARGLSLSPADAETCMVRELGDEVEQGDVIAQFHGAFTRLVRATFAGKIVDVSQGKVVLATHSDAIEIKAGMIGSVESIIPEFGAVLVNQGALIQGVWGNGQIGMGPLAVVGSTSVVALDEASLDSCEADSLVAAGVCLHASVLAAAQEKALAGLILGGLAPELKNIALKMNIPVIVLGGFGVLPIDPINFALFRSEEGQVASVNASPPNLYAGVRPEVIIPNQDGELAQDMGYRVKLSLGQRVRVLSGTAQGQVGEVVELPQALFRFESGLAVHSAKIRLMDGQFLNIPRQNLEVMA